MLDRVKEGFRKVSWPGFMSVILAIIAAVVFVFATVEAATFIILFAIYFVLVSFRDE